MIITQRRNVDPSFKLEVVRMLTAQRLSISHVSQTIDIGVTAIRRWMEQYEAEQRGPAMNRQTVDG